MVSPSNNTDKNHSIDQLKTFEDKRKKCDRDNRIKVLAGIIFATISFVAISLIPLCFPIVFIVIPLSKTITGILFTITAFVTATIFVKSMCKIRPKYSDPERINEILSELKKISLDDISDVLKRISCYSITDLYKCGIINAKTKKEIKASIKEWNKNREKLNSYNFYITVIEFCKGHDSKLHKYILKKVNITVTKNQELEKKWEDLRVKEIIPNLPAPLEIPIKA